MVNILYIDCKNSGITGDMFLAAIYGLKEDDSILQNIQTYVNENFGNAKLTQVSIEKIPRNGMFPNYLNLNFSESKSELHVEEIQEHIPKLCNDPGGRLPPGLGC